MSNMIDTTNESGFLYAKSIMPQMKEISVPLKKYFNIETFNYIKVYKDHSYLALWNNNEQYMKHYFMGLHDPGNCLQKFYKEAPTNTISYKLCPEYPSKNDSLLTAIYEHGLWHWLVIGCKTQDYFEDFGFCFKRGTGNTSCFFLNNLNILNEFVRYFHIAAKDFIDSTNKTKLATYKNKFDLNLNGESLSPDAKIRKKFSIDIKQQNALILHEKQNFISNFTQREYHCIELLAQGRTMKEIGRILNISPRTVECYIENVKNKTGCNYKSQLLDIFFESKS